MRDLVASECRDSLAPHCNLLIQALVGPLGSGNSSVRSSARKLLAVMLEQWEAAVLAQPMVTALPKATDKAKVTIYEEILSLVPRLHASKPGLILKQVVPAVKLLMEEHKSELKQLATRLTKSLYDLLGGELINCMNQEQLPKLMALLENAEG